MNTVAAISTPRGKGGVAMIRVSGDDALEIAGRVFLPKSGVGLESVPSNRAVYGRFHDKNGEFDDGLVTVFRAPHSFTGENTAELCCHGGLLVTKKLLEAVIASGAGYAGAGEFTRRAFINGKLSLSEAEAIGGIIDAKSEAYLSTSLLQLDGAMSRKCGEIYNSLTRLAASVYAYIDYPDEDLTDVTSKQMKSELLKIHLALDGLDRTRRFGKAITEGVSAAIVGRPNTGKSSVLNLLCGSERAIVTDIQGTTRDVITEQITAGNVLLNLADTAGIRQSDDPVERLGIEKSVSMIKNAFLIIFVTEGELTPQDRIIADTIIQNGKKETTVLLCNKADIGYNRLPCAFPHELMFSAKTGLGRDELLEIIADMCGENECDDAGTVITSARQHASVTKAKAAVEAAIGALDGFTQDIAGMFIEEAIAALGELDGKQASEEIVNEIFSHFCVGK